MHILRYIPMLVHICERARTHQMQTIKKVTELLIKCGADWKTKDRAGRSSLALACLRGNLVAAAVILRSEYQRREREGRRERETERDREQRPPRNREGAGGHKAFVAGAESRMDLRMDLEHAEEMLRVFSSSGRVQCMEPASPEPSTTKNRQCQESEDCSAGGSMNRFDPGMGTKGVYTSVDGRRLHIACLCFSCLALFCHCSRTVIYTDPCLTALQVWKARG